MLNKINFLEFPFFFFKDFYIFLEQKLITLDNTNTYKQGFSKYSETKLVQEEWTVELQCKQFPKHTLIYIKYS